MILPMKKLIIKLGGSIVTYKDSPGPKAKLEVIKKLAREIAELHSDYQIVLVHGVGSFAHPQVKKYDLHNGFSDKNIPLNFSEVTTLLTNLNSLITHELNKVNLPVISLLPHSFVTQKNRQLESFDTNVIEKLLDKNLIPVLCGDMVLDSEIGCSVLSGDTIMSHLANHIKFDKVIFLTDVDGIFDDNPKTNPKAKLIPEVNNENLKSVLKGIKQHNQSDVTGEMEGKILSIKQNLAGVPVLVANGLVPGNLKRLVNGDPIGTKLLLN